MRGGGDGSLGSETAFLSTLWKNFKMPCCSSNWISASSSDGGGDKEEIDERSEDSSSAMMCGCSVAFPVLDALVQGKVDVVLEVLQGGEGRVQVRLGNVEARKCGRGRAVRQGRLS